jgi:hypothetical protein
MTGWGDFDRRCHTCAVSCPRDVHAQDKRGGRQTRTRAQHCLLKQLVVVGGHRLTHRQGG